MSAQLIRMSDQTHLWAQNYDSSLQDLIEVENKIGLAIASNVKANLALQRRSETAATRNINPEAYDLYLRGRFYWNQRTPEAIKQSIELFQQDYQGSRFRSRLIGPRLPTTSATFSACIHPGRTSPRLVQRR